MCIRDRIKTFLKLSTMNSNATFRSIKMNKKRTRLYVCGQSLKSILIYNFDKNSTGKFFIKINFR